MGKTMAVQFLSERNSKMQRSFFRGGWERWLHVPAIVLRYNFFKFLFSIWFRRFIFEGIQ